MSAALGQHRHRATSAGMQVRTGIRAIRSLVGLAAVANFAFGVAMAQQSTKPSAGTTPPSIAPTTKQAAAKPPKKVDLNNATLEELKTLPTIGDAEAKRIIAHRPYKSKGELVTKAGLPEGVLQAVSHRVEMQTPRKAAPKK